jgi:hypothetical protein
VQLSRGECRHRRTYLANATPHSRVGPRCAIKVSRVRKIRVIVRSVGLEGDVGPGEMKIFLGSEEVDRIMTG